MIVIYNAILHFGMIIGFPIVLALVFASKKRRKTVLYRIGLAKNSIGTVDCLHRNSTKKVIWVHALSVGEVISSIPLVQQLKTRFKNHSMVFSATTQTGFDVAIQNLQTVVDEIVFFPYDLPFCVKRKVRNINPSLVVIVETDIWPNFLFEMKRQRIPVILSNARLSTSSFKGYRWGAFFTKYVFSIFSKICVQSDEDAYLFKSLGIPNDKIQLTGNLKFDQPVQPMTAPEISSILKSLNIRSGRKILLAGSTHKNEEAILSDVFSMLRNDVTDLLLIVAPRDPERSKSVLKIYIDAGFSATTIGCLNRLEKDPQPSEQTDVIIIDAIGILKQLYALADIAFIGGSLVNIGGHNPLEAAAFSKPILFGPDMSNFSEISQMLLKSGGAVQVHDTDTLYQAASEILCNSIKTMDMGKKAFTIFNANKGAVDKTLSVISSVITSVGNSGFCP